MQEANTDIILEVWETVDGYVIKRSDNNGFWGNTCWSSRSFRHDWGHHSSVAFHYGSRWYAVWVAKRIEGRMNRERREARRRANFQNKKVWR